MATTAEKSINTNTPSATQAPVQAAPVTSAKTPAKAARKPAAKKPVSPVKAGAKPVVKTVVMPLVKTAAPAASKPVIPPKTDKSSKDKKPKLVRDSFTMPKPEYEVIDAIKARCLRAGVSAKKSQILRAAVTNLARLSDASLARLIQNLAVIKTGRPKKSQ